MCRWCAGGVSLVFVGGGGGGGGGSHGARTRFLTRFSCRFNHLLWVVCLKHGLLRESQAPQDPPGYTPALVLKIIHTEVIYSICSI